MSDIKEMIKKEFSNFKVLIEDSSWLYLKDGEGHTIRAIIIKGSLGVDVQFVVEKKGCRTKPFFGRDLDNTIKRIKKYLMFTKKVKGEKYENR